MKAKRSALRRLIRGLSLCLLFVVALRLLLAARPSELPPSAPGFPPAKLCPKPLPAADPLTLPEKCQEPDDQQRVRGARLFFRKHERAGGTLQRTEMIEVFFLPLLAPPSCSDNPDVRTVMV